MPVYPGAHPRILLTNHKIVPAVPSPSGVADVFAFQYSDMVEAITSDGTTAWTADVSNAYEDPVPDFLGGLVLLKSNDDVSTSIVRLDGMTGQPAATYTTPAYQSLSAVVPHPDGTIFAVQQDSDALSYSVIGIDSAGGLKFSVPMGQWSNDWGFGVVSNAIIAGDGNYYVAYNYYDQSQYPIPATMQVVQVGSDGSSSTAHIMDWESYEFDHHAPVRANIITNADQGVLLSIQVSSLSTGNKNYFAVVGGGGGGLLDGPDFGSGPVEPVLQAQDGSFVGTVDTDDGSQLMVAFDASGGVRWTVGGYTPQIATDDGGVIATGDSGSAVVFDQNGSATKQITLYTQSWTGNMYQDGPVDRVSSPSFCGGSGLWENAGGNPSANGVAIRPWCFALSFQNDFTFTPENPGPKYQLTTDISNLAPEIKAAALRELKDAYSGVPVRVVEGTVGDVQATVVNAQNLNSTGICGASLHKGLWQHQASYVNNMLQVQDAYQVVITSAQAEQTFLASDFGLRVIRALGRGLGVTAAHEIAHQFVSDTGALGGGLMDANPYEDPDARGTFNAKGCSGSWPPKGDPSPWLGYWPSDPPIFLHWEAPALRYLTDALGKGWHKQ